MRYDETFNQDGFHSALLTSYSYDPVVFRNVILTRMRGNGCRNIAVLVDQDMLNRTLSLVKTAERAGSAYHLAKRAVSGAFHPKIVLRLGKAKGSLMIGSANLTTGGLTGNMEALAELTISEAEMSAAPLLAYALKYFERHSDPKDKAMRDALSRARDKTPWLADVEGTQEIEVDGRRLLLATDDDSAAIGENFASFIGDDTIDRLIVVSPYWDKNLSGLERLRSALGMPDTAMIVDAGADEQGFTRNAFISQKGVTLHSTEQHDAGWDRKDQIRRLHAKVIIACGEEADYVLAGSANVTAPGLYGRYGGEGNAEACLIREEPRGTALDRLGLSVCLSEEMALEDLKLRPEGVDQDHVSDEDLIWPPDGGSMWIEHGSLFWRPPSEDGADRCRLELADQGGILIDTVRMSEVHGQWTCNLSMEGAAPRIGIVVFGDGTRSAPVPIASLSGLGTNATAPRSGHVARLFAELDGRDDLDMDDYERALKVIMASTKELGITRDRKGKKKEQSDVEEDKEPRELTEQEYGERALTKEEERALRDGPVSEIRRFINSCLGLDPREFSEDDDDELTKAMRKNKTGSGGDDGDGNGDGDGPNGGGADDRLDVAPEYEVLSWDVADERAWRINDRVDETCEALGMDGVEPLSYLHAIRLHILINVLLKSAAAVGQDIDERHPICAFDPARSWVRMIGRIGSRLVSPLSQQVQAMGSEQLQDECLDALATILFAVGLAESAAKKAELDSKVTKPLERVHGNLAQAAVRLAMSQPTANDYIRKAMPALEKAHCRLLDSVG